MNLTSFIATYALIAMTPGPNMAVVARASLRHGRGAALLAVAGVAVGAALLTACVIAAVVHLPRTSIDISGFGALYGLFVIWMGVGCLQTPGACSDLPQKGGGFWKALLVASVNPYTALLVLTYTTGAETAQIEAAAPALVLSVFLIAGGWLSCVALGLSSRRFARTHLRVGARMEQLIGILLIALGAFSVFRTVTV